MSAIARAGTDQSEHEAPAWGRWFCVAAGVVLALAVIAAYSNCGPNAFALDDWHSIEQNPSIRGLDAGRLKAFFTDLHAFSVLPANLDYRPLLLVSYAINYEWSGWQHGNGYDPRTWHWVNMGLHWLACMGLLSVGRALVGAGRLSPLPGLTGWGGDALALGAAFLFAIHPVTTECVNYISARSSLMVAAFVLPALAVYLGVVGGRYRPRWLVVCWLLAAAAMFTKVEAVALLGVLCLAEVLFRPGSGPWVRRAALRLAPFLVLTVAYLALWKRMSTLGGNPQRAAADMTAGVYLLTQVRAWWYYLGEVAAPVRLVADDTSFAVSGGVLESSMRAAGEGAYSVRRALADPAVWLAAAGWGFVGLVCVRLWRAFPAAAFLAGSYLIFLAPHSSVVPLAEMVNGHRPYLAVAGVFILAMSGIWLAARALAGHPGAVTAAVVAVLAVPLTALTRDRNLVWRDDASLWGDSARKSPDSARAQMNYGLALMRRGRDAEAEARFRRTLEIWPYYHYAHTNLAIVMAKRGDHAGAMAAHNAAVGCAQADSGPYYWRGYYRAQRNDLAGAIEDLQEAVKRNPASFNEAAGLAECLERAGRTEEAKVIAQRYGGRDPAGFDQQRAGFRGGAFGSETSIGANDRGVALMGERKYAEAEALFKTAIRLDPRNSLAYTNMGIVRAAQGDAADAAEWHAKAIEVAPLLSSPRYWRARWLAQRGELDRAIGDLTEAVHLQGAGTSEAAGLIECLIRAGRAPEAEQLLKQWGSQAPVLDQARGAFRSSVFGG